MNLYKPELIIFIQKTMNGYSSLYSKYSHVNILKENEYIVYPQSNNFLTINEYIFWKTLFMKSVKK